MILLTISLWSSGYGFRFVHGTGIPRAFLFFGGTIMKQGCSGVTKTKEIEIRGIFEMRLNMRKYQPGYFKRIRIFDIFCGDGENSVDGETILGSPFEIINAIESTKVYRNKQVEFLASDNRQFAIDTLSKSLNQNEYPFSVKTIKMPADESISLVGSYLRSSKLNHAILLVDPNGPGVIPFQQLNNLRRYSSRLDVIINISESAINRIKGCGITKDKNWWANYENFEAILCELRRGYKWGWLRDCIKGDKQRWRLIVLSSWAKPKRNWEKQGLYLITSDQDITDMLDGRFQHDIKNPSIGPMFA
jgi:three-Cys-motif partner protein